jgi:osmotically inducible protein OsmC
MKKSASAIWTGGIKDGQGAISTQTGVLRDAPYGFKSRFEDGPGTNPEELAGAAHAGCFTMALSLMLGEEKLVADRIETKAEVSLEKVGEGFEITAVDLTVEAIVPGTDQATFERIATKAKENCPISKLFKGTKISLKATLKS